MLQKNMIDEITEYYSLHGTRPTMKKYKISFAEIREYLEFGLIDRLVENFIKKTKKHKIKYKKIKYKQVEEPVMLEIGPVDHHYGQMSWGKETGYGNYDIKIARTLYLDAIDYLIRSTKSYGIEKIVFIIGSDFFNVDSHSNTTTSGTYQDEDCRWQKSFDYGVDILIDSINMLRKVAPVDVIQVPGNHDEERIYYAGAFIKAWFHNCDEVNVDTSPKVRKYYRYGKNLIGYTHGYRIKIDRLFHLMPLEQKDNWSKTKHREWHVGHVHHETRKMINLDSEEASIKVKTLSSLVVPDAWHTKHGFIADRQAQAFIWHKEHGNIAQYNYRPVS